MTLTVLRPNHRARALLAVLVLCLGAASGCSKTEQLPDDDNDSDGGAHAKNNGPERPAPTGSTDAGPPKDGGAPGNGSPDGGSPDSGDDMHVSNNPDGNTAPTLLPSTCNSGGRCVVSNTIDAVDLLFVVDNSNSMKEEQARLRTQFAPLISALTTGHGASGARFTPASLHIGVVSTDMGLPGVEKVQACVGLGGDGLLQHAPTDDPSVAGCGASYANYLQIEPDGEVAGTATDLQCIGTLGTEGCGFEQQLEAPLKALWPSTDNRIQFLIDPATGIGALGHGDTENKGFERDATGPHASILAILVVSDEDDGSSSSVEHFIPKQFLDPNDPRFNEPLNLRNFFHEDELFPVTRYIDGLKALRPDAEGLVVFGAIVGVPPDLVDADHTRDLASDAMVRQAFYDGLLADTRMQEQIDPASMSVPGQGNLLPSCSTLDAEGTPNGKAYPARRIVQVAQGFGADGVVGSICDADFGPSIDQFVNRIGARLGSGCLDGTLSRGDDGLVANCKVLWQLAGTKTCADSGDFLQGVNDMSTDALCEVTQLPVVDGKVGTDSSKMGSSGWYYDDFSDTAELCMRSQRRIAFTDDAQPPTGARVILQCK